MTADEFEPIKVIPKYSFRADELPTGPEVEVKMLDVGPIPEHKLKELQEMITDHILRSLAVPSNLITGDGKYTRG